MGIRGRDGEGGRGRGGREGRCDGGIQWVKGVLRREGERERVKRGMERGDGMGGVRC